MRTLLRVVVILMVALVVAGVTYAVGSSEWVADRMEGSLARGGPGGFEAREGLGPPEGELQDTEGFQGTQGDSGSPGEFGRREGGRSASVFSSASLISFAHTLVPMALVIGAVTLLGKVIGTIRRRSHSAIQP
jgi:hypothetical protein